MRRDALPENITYQDRGCSISPHCLIQVDRTGAEIPGTGCPLPRCRFDEEEESIALLRALRDADVSRTVSLFEGGESVALIALEFGVTTRTITRRLLKRRLSVHDA